MTVSSESDFHYRVLFFFVILVSVTLSVQCGSNPTAAPSPQPETPAKPVVQTVVFSSSRALNGDDARNDGAATNIWLVNEDGGVARPLTNLIADSADNFMPLPSPDGTKIAFMSNRLLDGSNGPIDKQYGNCVPSFPGCSAFIYFHYNFWVMNADGSDAKPLTRSTLWDLTRHFGNNEPNIGQAAWSPDGKKIAFVFRRPLDGSDFYPVNIWLVNADATGLQPLTKLTAATTIAGLDWSPDGSRIAYWSTRSLDGSDRGGSRPNIWVMNADGSNSIPLTRLTAANVWSRDPSWSPDGTRIVYSSQRALDGSDAGDPRYITNLWVVNVEGTESKPLTSVADGIFCVRPKWSPDGLSIAFESNAGWYGDPTLKNPTYNVWVMNADGASPRPLTKLTSPSIDTGELTWFANGAIIAYRSNRLLDGRDLYSYNAQNIWMIRLDGTGDTPITLMRHVSCYEPQWLPVSSNVSVP